MGKATTKKKVEEEITEESATTALTKALKTAIPQPLADRLKQLEDEHESNFRLHPDKVAVFEVNQPTIPTIDGTNGWYDVVTGTDRSRELGLSETAEFTKQGLRITDHFEVKYHPVFTEGRHHEYVIVTRKEWEAKAGKFAPGRMLSGSSQMADLMQRSVTEG